MVNGQNVVTIDGPSGVGKSSVARRVAKGLKFRYLDTGAMYRAMTLALLEAGADLSQCLDLLKSIRLSLSEKGEILLNGESVEPRIRSKEVTRAVSQVSRIKEVREMMVRLQQAFGSKGALVAEGRDLGSVVFPNAAFKFYLDADPQVRAQRRMKQDQQRLDKAMSPEDILKDQERRDSLDSKRSLSPLLKTDDMTVIDTTKLTLEQVVEMIIRNVKSADGF